jgi:undecaprenyl diphosphate synthase
MSKLPRHIAIVMDGNGRWAKERGLPRLAGHKAGAEIAKEIIKVCSQRGIEVLTLFAFGTENWNRPSEEVGNLMKLFFEILQKNTKDLNKYNVQLRIIGDCTRLNKKLQEKIIRSQHETANNSGLKLNAAINYSGRWDIWQAIEKIVQKVETGKVKHGEVTQEYFQSLLCLHNLPEPDLFIRTSGEQRISNFLLWQLAYTELYFTDVLWPDFHEHILEEALLAYAKRERRFGGL